MIHGEGRCPADIAIIGEGPGWEEARDQRPFRGKTGRELRRFMNGIDLPAVEDVWLTNIYRDYRGSDYSYTAADLAECTPFLRQELLRVRPSTIVTLGRHAARWFLGDVDLGEVQGIPWHDPSWVRVIFPIMHPAAGLHNSDLSTYVVSGFQQLAAYLRGEIEPRKLFDDSYVGKEVYEEITSLHHLESLVRAWTEHTNVALDTEGWLGAPWSLQFATDPGRAYLIRANRTDLLSAFGTALHRIRPHLTFHSALHDLGMGRALGIDFDGLAFDDTMVMAYLLQIEEQGLKPLCVRHCGMQMSSYGDLVAEPSQRLAVDYLTWLWDMEQVDYEACCQEEFERRKTEVWTDKAGKTRSGRRITKIPQLPKTDLHKAIGRCLQSKDARKLWGNQIEDIQVEGYKRLGPIPEATLDYVPQATAINYGCRDADGTIRLRPELSRRLDAMGLHSTYNLELNTYPLIARMYYIGIKPNLDHFAKLSQLLSRELTTLQTTLERIVGQIGFNANSGDQVAVYLFDNLQLEGMKRTSSGRYSTNDKILEGLEHAYPEHPVISTIREYREVFKLKNTFVDRLPDFVNRWPYDGRIHATFRTTRVVTGRLAASDPNLLAQPEHGKFAPDFKRGWVCEPGHVLCAWDESQIELRGLAHLSQDPVLLNAFRTGTDLHAVLAERIFGVKPKDQDKSKHRLPAKAINFGIPMGMTNRGLAVELRKNGVMIDEDDAQRWLDDTLRLYAGVAAYMEQRKAEARQHGFVRCLSGRIRYIGGIASYDDRIREEAERFAFSTPIQESATYIMKQAEATIWNDIIVPWQKQGIWIEPLLQIHDSLRLEVEEGLEQDLHACMQVAMTQVPHGFSVPLAVDGEYGYNMADMGKF